MSYHYQTVLTVCLHSVCNSTFHKAAIRSLWSLLMLCTLSSLHLPSQQRSFGPLLILVALLWSHSKCPTSSCTGPQAQTQDTPFSWFLSAPQGCPSHGQTDRQPWKLPHSLSSFVVHELKFNKTVGDLLGLRSNKKRKGDWICVMIDYRKCRYL